MDQNLIALTLDLVHIKSENPPGNELEISEVIKSRLKNYISYKEIKTSENRVNLIFGDGETLVFNGHMDTVPIGKGWTHNPLGEISGSRIYGRGSSDMKGALASLIIAVENIVDSGDVHLLKKCKFAFVADEEEGGNYGTKAILDDLKGRYGVVMEGSVYNGEIFFRPGIRGSIWLKLISHGRSAHSSNPSSGVNAVMNLAEVLMDLKNMKIDFVKHAYLPDPTFSIGTTFHGGEKVNVIPDYAEATLDIRTIPSVNREEIIKKIDERIKMLKKKNNSIDMEIKVLGENPSAEIPVDSKIIINVKKSVREVAGYEPKIIGGMGSNDAPYMIINGTETIVLGPGDFLNDRAHGKDESVSIDMLEKFTKIYERVIRNA